MNIYLITKLINIKKNVIKIFSRLIIIMGQQGFNSRLKSKKTQKYIL